MRIIWSGCGSEVCQLGTHDLVINTGVLYAVIQTQQMDANRVVQDEGAVCTIHSASRHLSV